MTQPVSQLNVRFGAELKTPSKKSARLTRQAHKVVSEVLSEPPFKALMKSKLTKPLRFEIFKNTSLVDRSSYAALHGYSTEDSYYGNVVLGRNKEEIAERKPNIRRFFRRFFELSEQIRQLREVEAKQQEAMAQVTAENDMPEEVDPQVQVMPTESPEQVPVESGVQSTPIVMEEAPVVLPDTPDAVREAPQKDSIPGLMLKMAKKGAVALLMLLGLAALQRAKQGQELKLDRNEHSDNKQQQGTDGNQQ